MKRTLKNEAQAQEFSRKILGRAGRKSFVERCPAHRAKILRTKDFGAALVCAVLALPANACEYLTEHFEVCLDGTPWANGTWENGGDSATLYLGDLSFEGFEDYPGKDLARAPADDLAEITAPFDNETRVVVEDDRFRTPDLRVVRRVDMVTFKGDPPRLVVQMIAAAKGQRLHILMNAPAAMPVPRVKELSQDMATRIHPRPENADG